MSQFFLKMTVDENENACRGIADNDEGTEESMVELNHSQCHGTFASDLQHVSQTYQPYSSVQNDENEQSCSNSSDGEEEEEEEKEIQDACNTHSKQSFTLFWKKINFFFAESFSDRFANLSQEIDMAFQQEKEKSRVVDESFDEEQEHEKDFSENEESGNKLKKMSNDEAGTSNFDIFCLYFEIMCLIQSLFRSATTFF